MMTFYSGTPGSGKSLHVAEDIYTMLRRGRNVIANFDIDTDRIKPVFPWRKKGVFLHVGNHELTPAFLVDFAKKHNMVDGEPREGMTLVVVDECQLLYNARSFSSKDRMAWCEFYTQHRKYGYNFILISQFDRMVDRQIRSLFEYEIRHRKINNYKVFGWILGLLAGGSLFVGVKYWYGAKLKIGADYFVGKKKYYKLYNSCKLFDSV